MQGNESGRMPPWLLALAAVGAASAAAFGLVQVVRSRRQAASPQGDLDRLEGVAVDVLRQDTVTGACAIDVAALAPGILELTGTVPTHEAGQRAARLLHTVAGVKTVINRVDVEGATRPAGPQRWGGSGSAGGEWTGMRVGMGRRRQSPETDPDQRDDSAKLLDRSLQVDPGEVAQAVRSERMGGAAGERVATD
jgi:hypothetical protein